MSSVCANWGWSWLSMCLSETVCRSRARCRKFQRLLPDEAACATHLERSLWSDGFVCQHGETPGYLRYGCARPGVLRCRKCCADTSLTAETVRCARTHCSRCGSGQPYLVASQTPGKISRPVSAATRSRITRRISRFLRKLRADMTRPDRDRIGDNPAKHIETDETCVGNRAHRKDRGARDMVPVADAIEANGWV